MEKTKKKIIVANWKMNKVPQDTKLFFDEFIPLFKNIDEEKKSIVNLVFCVPYVSVITALESVKKYNIKNIFVGAQNCYFENFGAFTGEVSASMLNTMGACYSIIGHSERRSLFNDTDEIISKKVDSCLSNNLKVILCVGENLEQKKSGLTEKIIKSQLEKDLNFVTDLDFKNITVAYEPVWSIGSKQSAPISEVERVVQFIRDCILKIYGKKAEEELNVIYGGSLNLGNASDILKIRGIDGGLFGRASLNSKDFFNIINSVCEDITIQKSVQL